MFTPRKTGRLRKVSTGLGALLGAHSCVTVCLKGMARGIPTGGCLDENTLAQWMDGTLAESQRESARAHVDTCEGCQRLLGAASRMRSTGYGDSLRESEPRPPEPERLTRGTSVGRYVILEHVGSGGMASVYSAYDPELDRKIALKFLHPHLQRMEGLIRQEAQVMARLSHPNIVAVHDVGRLDDRVFVAMEFVAGETLARHLVQRRSWRDVVAVFAHAGRGLEAAHAAGVVHGDFKPQNVLVRGDGRVLVADFGLARYLADEAREPATPSGNKPRGTPAYMAPEQFSGATPSVRSDVFSYCAALYEALDGALPFAGDSTKAVLESMRKGPRPITARGVPGWLSRTVMRGLSQDPNQRAGSMGELLTALTYRPPRRRLAVSLSAGVLLAVATVAWTVRSRSDALARCRDVAPRLEGIWDPPRRAEVQRALGSVKSPYASDVSRRVTEEMDHFIAAWGKAYANACEAGARETGADATAYLRMACLTQQLSEARAKSDLLARADLGIAHEAIAMVTGLGEPASCGAGTTRTVPPIPPPELRPDVERVREQLTRVKALEEAARNLEAKMLAEAGLAAATQAGWRPLQAEALLSLSETQRSVDQAKEARQSAIEAAFLAESSNDDWLAARAWMYAAFLSTERFADFQRAAELERHAEVDLKRGGGDDNVLAELRDFAGVRLYREGRFEASLALEQQSTALFEKLGREDRFYSWALNDEAIGFYGLNRLEEAVVLFSRALVLKERLLGEHHPDVAITLCNLADVYTKTHRYEEAAHALARAERILHDAADPDPFLTLSVQANAGDLAYARGDYPGALDRYNRALAGAKLDQRNVHQTARGALIGLGRTLIALGRPQEAISHLERALPADASEIDPIDLGDASFELARALAQTHRELPRARSLAKQAQTAYVNAGPRGAKGGSNVQAWLAAAPL